MYLNERTIMFIVFCGYHIWITFPLFIVSAIQECGTLLFSINMNTRDFMKQLDTEKGKGDKCINIIVTCAIGGLTCSSVNSFDSIPPIISGSSCYLGNCNTHFTIINSTMQMESKFPILIFSVENL